MAGNKKTRKPMRHTRVAIPEMVLTASVAKAIPHLATSLYGQIYAFCEAPRFDTSNHLNRTFACIAVGMSHMNKKGVAIRDKRDAASIAMCSASSCVEAIGDRYARTGIISVTDLEKKTLHAAAGRLDEVLQGMPMACWLRGEAEADRWLKERMPQEAGAWIKESSYEVAA